MFNYRSSHHWIERAGVKAVARGSAEEGLLYHCLAFGIDNCTTSPSPSPSPGGPLSAACKATTDKLCGDDHSVVACSQCVFQNRHALIAAGCPPASEGGAKAVEAYCESDERER